MAEITRKLKMGMVGGGQGAFIGPVHRMAAAMGQKIDLVAGCFSRDFENTKAMGRELHLDPARCYRTYQEMVEAESALPEGERLDFVAVVTPNNTHFPVSEAFLKTGFHVICDKPMTRTVEEAEALVKLVEETGLVFCLTHNYTGHPMVRHARELFRSGEMGQIRKVIVEYLQDVMFWPHEKEGVKGAVWRVNPEMAGAGGTLADVGTHALNLLETVTGEQVTRFCADTSTFLPDRVLDEDGNFLVRLSGGGKGVITISQIATGENNCIRLRVYTSEGSICWEQENCDELRVYRYNKPRQVLSRGGAYVSPKSAEASWTPRGHVEGYLEAFANIYRGAEKAIRAHIGGTPLKTEDYDFPTVYDGLRGVHFVYKSVESSQAGGVWVDL